MINPSNMTCNSDIQSLVERDRGMMLELEKMKEERKRIIESLTKDDQMVNKHSYSESNQAEYSSKQKQSNFDMIRSEYKTDNKSEKTKTVRNNSAKNKSLKSNNEQNNENSNDLKKQLSFGNIIKNKKPSVAEELILKQQSE